MPPGPAAPGRPRAKPAGDLSRLLPDYHRIAALAVRVEAATEDEPAAATEATDTTLKTIASNEIEPMASFGETLPETATTPADRPEVGLVGAPEIEPTPLARPRTR